VVFFYADGAAVAVESKFTEPWSGRLCHLGERMKRKYLMLHVLWEEWPNVYNFIQQPSPFEFLDSHQLIKHAIGLRHRNKPFKLIYLFFEGDGAENTKHWQEVREFSRLCDSDGVPFKVRSFQVLIEKLPEGEHKTWLTQRYL
jgi:hypothetical protein